MIFPGLRETFLRDAEQRSRRGRWSQTWFLVGAAVVFGVAMVLLLSFQRRH